MSKAAQIGECCAHPPRTERQIRMSVSSGCDKIVSVADQNAQMVSPTLAKSDRRLIQEALDNEYYETGHSEPGGLTKIVAPAGGSNAKPACND